MERVFPQNIEAECGVLGSLIVDPEAIALVADWLHPDDFYRDAHRSIYEAVMTLYDQHRPADFITLCDLLEQRGQLAAVGGSSYVTSLIGCVPTSGNLEYYARIVVHKAGFRRLIHAAGQIAALAYEEAEDAQERAEQLLFALQRHQTREFVPLAEVLEACLRELEAVQHREQRVLGVPTGFRHLDAALGGGLQRSDLVILAARPGTGKTSLALSIAAHVALVERKRVAFFSLEMGAKQLGLRLLSMQADEDQRRLRLGLIDDWDQVVQASDQLADCDIWIDETAGLAHTALRSRARRLQTLHGIDLVIVDYLQLMHAVQSDGKRFAVREQEIAEISRTLKAVAKDLQVPVLVLAQLNRAVEARQNKRPQLSDLRESGALENDADVVLFIYREDLPIVILENVVDAHYWRLWESWLHAWQALDYAWEIAYLNSMFVPPTPQSRDRMYFVAWKRTNRKPDLSLRPLAPCAHCGVDRQAVQCWKNPKRSWGKYGRGGQYDYRCPVCLKEVRPSFAPAATAIDWSLPIQRIGDRARPLKEKTMQRIASGLQKFAAEPFLVGLNHRRTQAAAAHRDPWPTQTTYDDTALVLSLSHGNSAGPIFQASERPFLTPTVREDVALVSPPPFLLDHVAEYRPRSIHRSLSTIVGGGNHHGLVIPPAWLMAYYQTGQLSPVSEPASTITTLERHALIVADTEQEKPRVEDCGFRMLEPSEIQAAMAFPSSYVVTGTRREKVKQLGNAVTPPVMKLLVSRCMAALA